jgi:hypothetical protein
LKGVACRVEAGTRMSYLRRISTRRLLALCAGVLVVAVATAAIALAATSGGPTPPPKPLPKAVHDALAAPQVAGVSARIEFTNHLLTSDNVQGSDPLLTGGSGRLWATPDGQLRVELQSDSARGDSEVVVNGRRFLVYSGDSNRAYRGRLPRESGKPGGGAHSKAIPSVTRIRRALGKLGEHLDLSGATPTDVAGRPAYRARVSPKSHGGLLGGAALAWDAVHGTPLEAAVYARGSSSPVLELKVTDISFGPVSSSVFDIAPAPGTKVDDLGTLSGSHGSSHHAARREVSGSSAVASKLNFRLHAPSALAGMQRQEVRLIRGAKSNGAVVTYGHGLDGLAVFQYPAAHGSGQAGKASGSGGELTVPKVSIGGVSADELQTPLGTVLHFKRGGVEYVVAGSVPRGVAEAAARGL